MVAEKPTPISQPLCRSPDTRSQPKSCASERGRSLEFGVGPRSHRGWFDEWPLHLDTNTLFLIYSFHNASRKQLGIHMHLFDLYLGEKVKTYICLSVAKFQHPAPFLLSCAQHRTPSVRPDAEAGWASPGGTAKNRGRHRMTSADYHTEGILNVQRISKVFLSGYAMVCFLFQHPANIQVWHTEYDVTFNPRAFGETSEDQAGCAPYVAF